MTLTIRPATREEIPLLLDWAAAEGWNPGLHDATTFHAADPEGFLLGLEDGTPIGCISAIKQGERHGFIGFYIMRPDRRGRGHGIALWRQAMQRLAGRTIGLDGVVAQQANYARSGFALAWRNIRYAAATPRAVPGAAPEPVLPATLVEAAALDALVFPEDRSAFLEGWMHAPGHRAVMLPGRAFGVLRPCREGAKLGPLTARDPAAARAVFNALIANAEGPIFLDLAEPNREAVALAQEAGMTPVFETARMYAGEAPKLDLTALYGACSFELG